MNLIFEEENYPKAELESFGIQGFLRETSESTVKCNYVGFYKNYDNGVAVFTLPKIFLQNGKVFSKYDFHLFAQKQASEVLVRKEYDIVRNLVERIYFCLRQFQKAEAKSILDREYGYAIKSNIGLNQVGSFEAMLALISFNKSNPDLLVQARQIVESKNPDRINWKRTLVSSVPVQVDNTPLYIDLVGESRKSKKSDPLLVIYYSLLNEFRQYDPTITFDTTVEILSPAKLSKLRPRIALFLRGSRSLYYSDKFKQLHSLLQSYYFAEKATYSNQRIEFLFTDNFNLVFENMVDSLISDEYLLNQYKHLKDGKEIDHLFGESDVFRGNKIIYIGDSKYYKDPARISVQRYKQFTYARNIIQENIYIINSGNETVYSRNYRDTISEGYNVTPNFFLLGTVTPDYLESPKSIIEPDSQDPEFSCHFQNRLFDRDTLHILYFDVDFVKLLNFYIGRANRLLATRRNLREGARTIIQTEFTNYLNDKYEFYTLNLSPELIEKHFKIFHGKLFSSPAINPKYVLALEKDQAENTVVLALLASLGVEIQEVGIANISEM